MSHFTHDLTKFLHYAYDTKLKELKLNKGFLTYTKLVSTFKKIDEIKRLLQLLETIQLQSYHISFLINDDPYVDISRDSG